MEQIAALEKEKENLARELASYINKEKDKVHRNNYLLVSVLSVASCTLLVMTVMNI